MYEYISPANHRRVSCKNQISVGVQYESELHRGQSLSQTPIKRTIICKDCEVQTDFSDDLSRLSLIEHPSPLFMSVDNRAITWRHHCDGDMSMHHCDSDSMISLHSVASVNPDYQHYRGARLLLVPCEVPGGSIRQWNQIDDVMKSVKTGIDTDHSTSDDVIQHVSAQTSKSSPVTSSGKKSTNKSTASKDTTSMRSVKKKMKREAQLSRAADVELAEISLEQHVLQQLTQRRLSVVTPANSNNGIHDNHWVNHSTTVKFNNLTLGGANNAVKQFCVNKTECEGHSDSDTPLSGLSDTSHLNTFTSSSICGFINSGSNTGSSKTSSRDLQFYVGTPSSSIAEYSPVSQNSPLTLSTPSASPLSSGVLSPSGNVPITMATNAPSVLSTIHSRRFREYCNQVLSSEIDDCCNQLLQHLVEFQNRVVTNDTQQIRKRTVLGLREVTKYLRLSKLKAVIISPNLEKIQSKGGLDEALYAIIQMCQEQRIPFIFALGRRALGRACAKPVPVSVVGIFSYDGAESYFERLRELTEKARQTYKELVASLSCDIEQCNSIHQTAPPVDNSDS